MGEMSNLGKKEGRRTKNEKCILISRSYMYIVYGKTYIYKMMMIFIYVKEKGDGV